MIIDKENTFDWGAALTASRASTDSINLVSNRDVGGTLGMNPDLKVGVTVDALMQSTGSSTLIVSVSGSTDGSAWDVYVTGPTMAKADLVAGASWFLSLPRRALGKGLPKQLRLNYAVGVADFTAGNISAYLVLDTQDNHAYGAAVKVVN